MRLSRKTLSEKIIKKYRYEAVVLPYPQLRNTRNDALMNCLENMIWVRSRMGREVRQSARDACVCKIPPNCCYVTQEACEEKMRQLCDLRLHSHVFHPPQLSSGVIVLVSNVTAAVSAYSPPSRTVAPVVAVIETSARILPAKEVVLPRVAELPTW